MACKGWLVQMRTCCQRALIEVSCGQWLALTVLTLSTHAHTEWPHSKFQPQISKSSVSSCVAAMLLLCKWLLWFISGEVKGSLNTRLKSIVSLPSLVGSLKPAPVCTPSFTDGCYLKCALCACAKWCHSVYWHTQDGTSTSVQPASLA